MRACRSRRLSRLRASTRESSRTSSGGTQPARVHETRHSKRSASIARGADEEPRSSVPFSSKRRWSAQQFGEATYVLGAPELFPPGELQTIAGHEARAGRRVVAFGVARGRVDADETPVIDKPLGLVVLGERLRADARETVEFLQSQGVRVFVISGDRPETVAAVAADCRNRGACARRARSAARCRQRFVACSKTTP